MIYKKNDIVLYSVHGVCKVEGVTQKEINGDCIEYYILKPLYEENSTVFVPVGNELLTQKMKHVISPDKIHEMIKSMPEIDPICIEDYNERKEKYRDIISNGNRIELMKLIKTLSLQQQEQIKVGKKLHVAEEKLLKEAEKILYDEFAHVLNLKYEDVLPFIISSLESSEEA